jgi:modulator of FtsH protease
MTALGLTGFAFLALSGYTLTTQKDFSFLRGFLVTGMMVVIGVMLLALVGSLFGLHVPGVQLAMSAAIVMLMSGFILFDTSRIVHGGETNYIMATVSLYLDIYNMFVALLHLVGAFGGDD